MKSPISNVLVIVAVIAVVAGVAWFRSAPQGSAEQTITTSAAVADKTSESVPQPAIDEVATVRDYDSKLEPQNVEVDKPAVHAQDELAASVEGADTPSMTATNVSVEPKKLPRVVDLGADQCVACKKLAPILEELKKEYDGRVAVEFIDVWKDPKAGEPYKISVIPTQIFFDADGNEVWRHVGFLPKEDFVAKFKELGVN